MKNNLIKNEKAFSLLEIVVSMLILSVAIAGNLALVNSSYKLLDQAKEKLKAANTAAGAMEQLRNGVRADQVLSASNTEKISYYIKPTNGCTQVRVSVQM
jgi:prepilin-type N-terminal cleavage/methylation domain-containing protein